MFIDERYDFVGMRRVDNNIPGLDYVCVIPVLGYRTDVSDYVHMWLR